MIDLSLILPVYNQENIISPVYKSIFQMMLKLHITFECILVENGSTDKSKQAVHALSRKYPHTISLSTSKGYGSAVIAGISRAHGAYIAYMPSDGQVDLKILPQLWKLATTNNFDIVKIHRLNRESFIRTITSKFHSYMVSILFHSQIIDINGSPRILKNKNLKQLNLHYHDSFIDTEMLIKATKLKWKIMELSMVNLDRYGGSSTRSLFTYFEFIKNLFSYTNLL